jgi:hypothetical protein
VGIELPVGLAAQSCVFVLSAFHIWFPIPQILGAIPEPQSTNTLPSTAHVASEESQKVVQGEHERKVNEFLSKYVRLSPEERVQLWVKSETSRNVNGLYPGARSDMRDVLVIEGIDAVPYLAQVIHSSSLQAQIDAVLILFTK